MAFALAFASLPSALSSALRAAGADTPAVLSGLFEGGLTPVDLVQETLGPDCPTMDAQDLECLNDLLRFAGSGWT